MLLPNLRIGARQAIGSGIMLAILLTIVVSGLVRVSAMGREIKGLAKDRIPKILLAARMQNNYQNTARTLRNIVLTHDHALQDQEKEKFNRADSQLNSDVAAMEKMHLLPESKAIMTRIGSNLTSIKASVDKALALGLANNEKDATEIIFKEIIPIQGKLLADLDALIQLFSDQGAAESDIAVKESISTKAWLLVLGCLGVLLGIGSAFVISRSVTKPIAKAVEQLRDAASLVASSSSQVASSSREWAAGASEQAASIEETSSSLEEMSSMTKQNAVNASHATELGVNTRTVVVKANESMRNLTESMEEISRASEETQKIVKTIDEIAFQTNLLALNAAVEAARAGEAGAGFAVVADEVRNLAMRAAEAARTTAGQIEQTVKRIKEGADIVQKTDSEFAQVEISATKMGELVNEISAASGEQAHGIEQVSMAVREMDKVVQKNSASAEESASAAAAMSAQSERLMQIVVGLRALVKTSGSAGSGEPALRPGVSKILRPPVNPALGKVLKRTAVKNNTEGKEQPKRLSAKAEQVIPFDELEDADF